MNTTQRRAVAIPVAIANRVADCLPSFNYTAISTVIWTVICFDNSETLHALTIDEPDPWGVKLVIELGDMFLL